MLLNAIHQHIIIEEDNKVAKETLNKIIHVTSRFSVKTLVPGCIPLIINTPNKIAVFKLPGIPNAKAGTNAPPTLPLLAASEAIKPRLHHLFQIRFYFLMFLLQQGNLTY